MRLFEATVLDLISKRGLAVVGVGVASGASVVGWWASEASGERVLPSVARLPPGGLASSPLILYWCMSPIGCHTL